MLGAYGHPDVLATARPGCDPSASLDGGERTLYICSPARRQAELAPLGHGCSRPLHVLEPGGGDASPGGVRPRAWARALCLNDDARAWELKRLRYRLLHQSGRIARHARQTTLRLARDWPWSGQLAAAFARLQSLPAPGAA